MTGAPPRAAASLILLRRGGRHAARQVEVLLVQRSTEASFMPGVWVFPGGAVDAADGEDEEESHRACAARELEEEAGIELPAEEAILPWSRWITPEGAPVRFDTRFYVALAPPHSPPKPDGAETVDAAWMGPAGALERHREGGLSLVFPTIKHLESLVPFASAEQIIEAARERRPEPILPRVIREGAGLRVVLPGDPGY